MVVTTLTLIFKRAIALFFSGIIFFESVIFIAYNETINFLLLRK